VPLAGTAPSTAQPPQQPRRPPLPPPSCHERRGCGRGSGAQCCGPTDSNPRLCRGSQRTNQLPGVGSHNVTVPPPPLVSFSAHLCSGPGPVPLRSTPARHPGARFARSARPANTCCSTCCAATVSAREESVVSNDERGQRSSGVARWLHCTGPRCREPNGRVATITVAHVGRVEARRLHAQHGQRVGIRQRPCDLLAGGRIFVVRT
jgi:hypothetical protein